MMIDIAVLRENTQKLRDTITKKKFTCDLDAILAMDAKRREVIGLAERARAEQSMLSESLISLPKDSVLFRDKVEQIKAFSKNVKALEAEAKAIDLQWQQLLLTIPNILHASVPIGEREEDSVVVKTEGSLNGPQTIPHWDIPWFSRAIDFERGVAVTGAGFPFFIGDMARLVRALIQFFLEEAGSAGYLEMQPPLLVNMASAVATGQLPDKEGMMYSAKEEEFYLIPTAEVPVTNYFRDRIVEERELPLYRCAYTPCFRREAGSWGKDVRGLNRLHQFDKVELVKWVLPETSFEELETLLEDAQRLLQKLELPYRVLSICSGQIGFPHAKQYDLEVWARGQKRWLEVSSCSNFTDFQARRAHIRYRPKEGGKPKIVHTLNGSALGLPRVLAAILENNWQSEKNTVTVPSVLQRWFPKEVIGPSFA